MKKNFFKITTFLLAVVLTFLSFYNVYNFKNLDSAFKVKMFYEQEDNTVDVLVLGSSHIYQGFNTAVLWREYGYSSYALCGSAQPIWNTYYYLEEALKTQTPKVIILDSYTLSYNDVFDETSNAIKNTYGLRWSQTKIDAIKASFDAEKSGNQYFFEVLQYHSKYSDLNKTDFYPYQANKAMYKNHKGFYCYFKTATVAEKDLSEVTYLHDLLPKAEEYYRKIIELAQSSNIPIIITAIPFAADSYNQSVFNAAKVIADEYGVPFYNFLTEYKDVVEIDYSRDFADSQHLNHLGNTKITRFFGDLLKEKYNIADKRGEEKYASWDADAQVYYNQLENSKVKNIKSLNDYAKVISNKRYITVITESLNDFDSLPDNVKNSASGFFKKLGISEDEYKIGGMWVVKNGFFDYYSDCEQENFTKTVRLSCFDTSCVKVERRLLEEKEIEGSEETEQIFINTKTIHTNKNDHTKTSFGINIYVYDTFTQTTVDALCYNYGNGQVSR